MICKLLIENDLFYFFRVYSYTKDDNGKKVLGNGSDRLKFKISFTNQVTSESTSVTDPVISTTTGSTVDTNDFEFGTLNTFATLVPRLAPGLLQA